MDEQQPAPFSLEGQKKQGLWALAYVLCVFPLDAFMVWLLWGFFVTPLGLPAISFWLALGLDLFASYMQSTSGISMGLALLSGHFKVSADARVVVKKHLSILMMVLTLAIVVRLLMGGF